TGRPVLTDVYDRAVKGETVEVWCTNATLMAFNPKTGLVYLNSWEIARILKYVKFEFVLGQGSTGVGGRRRPFVHGPAQRRVHCARSGHRSNAVEVQDRLGHQFASDHIHSPGTSIRHRDFRRRRRRQPEDERL